MRRNAWKVALGIPLLAGCLSGCLSGWNASPTALPSASSVVREQLMVFSDFPLPQHHRLLDDLVAQRSDLSQKLNLPVSDEPIYVYLFNTPESYEQYIEGHYPKLPARRAFFVETDTRLAVYARWGDRVAEDLRHEVAHGYLHAVVRDLPLWLDEGLAEYFEVPRGRRGVNAAHVELLVQEYQRGEWMPDLQRLELLRSIDEMTQRDYAAAWLWTHMLLESTPARRELLQNYLARLRIAGFAPPVSHYVRESIPHPERAVLEHLKLLASG